jgi:CheY-like chemotaxis protein
MKPGSRILVVDDNDDFREILRAALIGEGYRVTEAIDGEQALALLTSSAIDMAIVDLDMPKLNGLAFSKTVKEALPDFPIVMVTGYAQLYSPAEILSVGIDAFLEKPVAMEKILEVIRNI